MVDATEKNKTLTDFAQSVTEFANANQRYQKVLEEYSNKYRGVKIDDTEQLASAKSEYEILLGLYEQLRETYFIVYDAWLNTNPIRVERTVRGLSLMDLANVAEKSVGAIQLWERGGVKFPDMQGMNNIASFFGQPNLREKWETWRTRRPLAVFPPKPREITGA